MKKIVLGILIVFVASMTLPSAFAAYQPTDAELNFIMKVENQLRKRYKGKDIDGAVSEEIVEFMARLDKKLEDKTISPRLDWVFGTTKRYLLRIIERTFPWEVDAKETTTKTTTKSTDTKDETPEEDDEPETTSNLDRGTEYAGQYRLVDVDARKWTFMPALFNFKVGEKVKLIVHDVGLTSNIYFEGVQAWKDTKGYYMIDTSKAGEYKFYCAASCGAEYEKMVGTIVIE